MSPAINRRSIIEYPDWDFLKTPPFIKLALMPLEGEGVFLIFYDSIKNRKEKIESRRKPISDFGLRPPSLPLRVTVSQLWQEGMNPAQGGTSAGERSYPLLSGVVPRKACGSDGKRKYFTIRN
jgi:hypothetical protein